jgi:hypothetical protein
MTKKNNLLILIDCWEIKDAIHDQLYTNINDFIGKNRKDIHTIINATYDHLIKGVENCTTTPKLDPRQWFSKSFNMLSLPELIEYINRVPVDDIWYAGQHWNLCIRDRPLGWRSVLPILKSKNPRGKILFNPDCILDRRRGIDCFPDFAQEKSVPIALDGDGPYWRLDGFWWDNTTIKFT